MCKKKNVYLCQLLIRISLKKKKKKKGKGTIRNSFVMVKLKFRIEYYY
jgi:hypothetical protein